MAYRVFGGSKEQPDPRTLAELAHRFQLPVEGEFFGDDQGWTRLELQFGKARFRVTVERYLAEEEGLKESFRTWAAWIESANHDPANDWLMEHLINTQQLFTIETATEPADESLVHQICTELACHLARATTGIYQEDDLGLLSADGKLLVREEESGDDSGAA
ncbi:MAG TPA: hypothetical protein VKU02_06425 [Gemmataceae bacterium]|nr:hypothetical protein [Gemmataceae bacterium]